MTTSIIPVVTNYTTAEITQAVADLYGTAGSALASVVTTDYIRLWNTRSPKFGIEYSVSGGAWVTLAAGKSVDLEVDLAVVTIMLRLERGATEPLVLDISLRTPKSGLFTNDDGDIVAGGGGGGGSSSFADSLTLAQVNAVVAATAVGTVASTASPALTGVPTAPTAAPGTSTTQVATTAFVAAGLAGKAAASHTHTAAEISDSTAAGRALLTAADAAAQRTALSLGTAATAAASSFATAAQGALADSALQAVPIATASVLGGVKAGSGVSIAGDGTISTTASDLVERTAVQALGGHRAVVAVGAAGCDYADQTTADHFGKLVGITTGAVAAGAAAQIRTSGPIENTGWAFTAGQDVFLASNGLISQTEPSAGNFQQIVGYATTATMLWVSLSDPIRN